MSDRPPLIPCLRYADAPAAIEFLCTAFGFARHAVHPDPGDQARIAHAQLSLGGGMVMLGSAGDDATALRFGWRTPRQAGGITMCVYVTVDDADAHCAQARAAGAEIIADIHANEGYPGRSYTARDPEGNVWDFGTYDPRHG